MRSPPTFERWTVSLSVVLALLLTWRPALASGGPSGALEFVFFQVDSDLASRCAIYIQKADTPDDDITGDVVAICRALRAAARDGVNGPDDCVYFTTVVEDIPVKQAVAACQALLAPDAPGLFSAPLASAPNSLPGAQGGLAGPATPPWIDTLLAQLISAQIQISGHPPDAQMIDRLRACLIRNQDLGPNGALAPCAREVS
jgi:hypothetical protein